MASDIENVLDKIRDGCVELAEEYDVFVYVCRACVQMSWLGLWRGVGVFGSHFSCERL